MKNREISIGCGAAALVTVILLVFISVSLTKSFVKFGLINNIIGYRTTVLAMDIDEDMKKTLISDFEDLRRSISKKNNIGFFQWITIDSSISSIFSDEKISTDEYDILQSEIKEIKQYQNMQE
jgi:hypothetical protein